MLGGASIASWVAFAIGLSMATWNVQALFQSTTHSQHMAKKKHAVLSHLLGKFSVIGVQELHGNDADLLRLQNEAPQGRILGSPGPCAGVGGVLLWFGPHLVQIARDFVHEVIVPGRLHYVDVLLPNLVIALCR